METAVSSASEGSIHYSFISKIEDQATNSIISIGFTDRLLYYDIIT
jgi:hypothetical protein